MSAGSTDLPAQRTLGVCSFSVLRCSRTSSSARSEMCSHLFYRYQGVRQREGGGDTDDEKHVGVLRLHSRGDARVFVAREVLRVDHGDDCV